MSCPNLPYYHTVAIMDEQVDSLGRMVARTNIDRGYTIITSLELYSEPDIFGRPTKITYLDGTTSVNVKQDCCQSAYTIGGSGPVVACLCWRTPGVPSPCATSSGSNFPSAASSNLLAMQHREAGNFALPDTNGKRENYTTYVRRSV